MPMGDSRHRLSGRAKPGSCPESLLREFSLYGSTEGDM